jgi:glycosyltransferase involved in cell wall biosynthesis
MPVRDAERFLAAALDSVLGQSLKELELLAVDDGSRDASPAILARYAAADARVRVLSRRSEGIAAALNAGIADARAACIARMDADDVSEPDRLARQLAILDARPDVVLVGTAATLVDEHGRTVGRVGPPVDHDVIVEELRTRNALVHGSVAFRRAAWEAAGGYDQAAGLVEDYDLWCRLLAHGRVAGVAEPLYRLRVHADSVSARGLSDQLEATYGVRRRHFGTPRPSWIARRTARADRHLAYACMLAVPGAAVPWRHLLAAWRAKPWSPTVVRHGLAHVRGTLARAGAAPQ